MYENLNANIVELEQASLRSWEERVDTMDIFLLGKNSSLSATDTNKYNRFTGFLKEWCSNVMSGDYSRTPAMMGTCNTGYLINAFAYKEIPNNWWDTALGVGEGKEMLHTIPQFKTEAEKENVCAALMPAYRAVRDSFSKRWGFLSWIFNHDQYVAERDSMHVLSGLMQTLTGKTQTEIDVLYQEHKAAVPAGRTAAERKEYAASFRAAASKKIEGAQKDVVRDRDMVREKEIERDNIEISFDDEEESIEIAPQVNGNSKNAERNLNDSRWSDF